jgi:hypothetical protein
MSPRSALVLLACAVGCAPTTAVINGKTVPRPMLGYTDHETYGLTHKNAYPVPRGPSSGLWSYGGELYGTVCGMSVVLDAEYYGRFLSVTGFVTPAVTSATVAPQTPLQIEARDRNGLRAINGVFLGQDLNYNRPGFDLQFSSGALVGSVGLRRFDLRRDGDDRLRGTMSLAGYDYDFAIDGIDELWRMPVADQAVLLPLMLSCRYKYTVDTQDPLRTVPMLTVNFRDDERLLITKDRRETPAPPRAPR